MIDRPRFEHVARIDSTSSELMRRPFGTAPGAPVALLADAQDAGRGRNGRHWLSDPTRSVALSVAVEREADGASLLGLPLAVGAAIAGVLAAHGAAPRLKWPNDLLVAGPGGWAKAGGILAEVRQQGALQRIVVGCGLNLAAAEVLDDARIGQAAGALFAPPGAMPERVRLARELADAIAATVLAFPAAGLGRWLGRWRELDALADAPIELLRPDGSREPAIACGVDDDGALRARHPDGRLERVIAGEVSVRPRGAGDRTTAASD